MIRGIHGLFYSSDPEATRAFFRDQVKLPGCDVGQGWWIFDLPEGDMGIHPSEDPQDVGDHDVSFYCDDIHGTVADLKSRGVTFTGDVEDHGYGLVTHFTAPGGVTVQLYEPRYVKTTRKAAPKSKPANKAKAARRPAAKKKAQSKGKKTKAKGKRRK